MRAEARKNPGVLADCLLVTLRSIHADPDPSVVDEACALVGAAVIVDIEEELRTIRRILTQVFKS